MKWFFLFLLVICSCVAQEILYPNNLKNRFLTASDLPQNFRSHSRLARGQWSLAPNKNSGDPPCQIPDFSNCLGITAAQEELPHFGVLKKERDFFYVDLDDEYIHKLVKLIPYEGFEEPPYFENEHSVGAHISVIYAEEAQQYGITDITECGQTIFFRVKECQVAHPPKMAGVDEVYFIVVEAPELDLIREKYGLPKKKYDFHITIGVKPSYNTLAGTARFCRLTGAI